MTKYTKRSAALITAGVLAVSGGAAYAWTLFGTGSATASSASISNLLVTPTISTALYPGGKADVAVNVENTNTFPVEVTSITYGTIAAVDTAFASCASFITAVPASQAPLPTSPANALDIPAGDEKDIVHTGAVQMANNAPNTCAGKAFTISLTVNAETPA
jgi:hypothetical protein